MIPVEELVDGKGWPILPPIRPRSAWGADENMTNFGWARDIAKKDPDVYMKTVDTFYWHHQGDPEGPDIPATLRGIQRYHILEMPEKERFSDFGYLFAVSSDGVAWQGRRGPQQRPSDPVWGQDAIKNRGIIRQSHALGDNDSSIGVVLLGNFNDGPPTLQQIRMAMRLELWSALYCRFIPTAIKRYTWPQGQPRFGMAQDLPVIRAHGDTYFNPNTREPDECPGAYVKATMPEIRAATAFSWKMAVKELAPAFQPSTTPMLPSLVGHENLTVGTQLS